MLHVRLGQSCLLVCLLASLPSAANAQLVTAPGPGVSPAVRVIETSGTERTFFAYHPAFTGGVRIALGDVTGDGILDIVTGPGPGGGPHVRVWDGVTLTEVGGFFAYDPAFAGGVWVAAGDVDGDGRADIITGAGAGGGPHVRVWSGATFNEIGGFFAYDPAFPGGVSVAAGDVNADGRADIITGAGPGGGPHVRVWNATNFSEIGGFFAYDPAFPGGIQVGALDLTGDNRAEIITGVGPGGLPISSIWNGADLSLMGSYFAFDPTLRVGVFVGSVGKSSPLRFTSANNAAFTLGAAGSFTVTTAGGVTPPALTMTGALPSGVTFIDNGDGTATLAGTPGAGTAGTYPVTFSASTGTPPAVTQSFTLTVREAPVITSASSTSFNIGSVGSSFTITTTGSPAPTISVTGALPSGITFTDNGNGTGTLAGTAGAGTGGTYPLVITASNGVGTATQNFTLTIQQGAAITSANAVTFTVGVSGTFTVTTTGSPTATSILQGGALPVGVSFTNNGNGTATLAGTPAAATGGTYALTFTASNGVGAPAVQNFTLTVQQAPAITSAANVTFTVGVSGTFTVTTTGFPTPTTIGQTGALPGGVTFVNNGDGTATLAGTPAAATGGTYALTITASNSVGASAPQAFTLTVHQAPAITSAATVTFTVGVSDTFTVTTTGFPTPTIARGGVALPTGVTFTDNGNGTGTLAGTPAAGSGGTYAISFTATNAAGPASQPFTLTVQQAPAITSANTTTFTVAVSGTFTVTTTGFPAASIGSTGALPAGVTFTNNGDGTATIAGTPDPGTGGSYPLTLTATNGVGSPAVQTFTLTVNQPAAITSANTTAFVVGTPGTFTITTSGTPTVTTIAIGGAALPTGVTFTDNGNGTGTLAGTPAAGTGGTYALTFTATNGVGSPAVQNFTLTIQQAPAITSANSTSFTVGSAGSFSVTTTGIPVPGLVAGGATLPAGVTFVDNGNGTGTLSGTPGAGTAGPYALTFTADNSIGVPAVQNFSLTVACPAVALTPGAGALTPGTYQLPYSQVFGASGGTGHTFAVTAGSLPPGLTLASNGSLTGAPSNTGNFSFTVTATNSFDCTGSAAYTLAIVPNAGHDTYSNGVGNTQFVVSPAPTSATPAVLFVGTVLSNDAGPGTLTTGPSVIGAVNGTVALASDGAFVYTPNVGFAGPSDSFSYTLTDGNGITDTATVTINLSGVVWFVNGASVTNGDGRSHSPFNATNFAETPSLPGHAIYVHAGAGTPPNTLPTPGAIVLKANQLLHGSGDAFTFGGLSIPFGGFPTLAGTVTLADGAAVRSVRINTVSGPAITGTNLTGGESLVNVNIIGGSSGIVFNNVSGSVGFNTVGIANLTTGPGLLINGGNGSFAGRLSITGTNGRSVDIQNKTGGDVFLGGAIEDSGTGILLNNNSPTTNIYFQGGLALDTGASAAFTAAAGGTVHVCGTSDCAGGAPVVNTITTGTGTALTVTNTNIGSSGMTFRSISANGAVNGIVLNNTGALGGLTVTGNSSGVCGGAVTVNPVGTPATITPPVPGDCTGGTIQATTGAGIVLTNTSNVSLTRMRIANAADDGIQGLNVTGFSFIASLAENNGDAIGEGNLDFGDATSVTPDGMHGTGAITNSTIRGGFQRNVSIRNSGGAVLTAFNVAGSQIAGDSANPMNDDGILFEGTGTANMTVDVQNSYFAANKGDHFQAAASNSADLSVRFRTNTLIGGHSTALGQGITINAATGVAFGGYTGTVNYDIDGNTIQGAISNAITTNLGTSGAAGLFNGFVRNNVIGAIGAPESGSTQANGIAIDAHGNGTHTVSVTGNTIHEAFDRAISVLANDGGGILNLTVQVNVLGVSSNPLGSRESFFLNNASTTTNVFGEVDHHTVRLDLGGAGGLANTLTHGVGALDDFRIRQRFDSRIEMPGYGGAPFDVAAVVAYIQGRNTGSVGEPGSATANDSVAVVTDGFFSGTVPLPVPF